MNDVISDRIWDRFECAIFNVSTVTHFTIVFRANNDDVLSDTACLAVLRTSKLSRARRLPGETSFFWVSSTFLKIQSRLRCCRVSKMWNRNSQFFGLSSQYRLQVNTHPVKVSRKNTQTDARYFQSLGKPNFYQQNLSNAGACIKKSTEQDRGTS